MLKRYIFLLCFLLLLYPPSNAREIDTRVTATYLSQSHLALTTLSPQVRSLESRFYNQRRDKQCVALSGSITTDSGQKINLQDLMPSDASCGGSKRLSIFLDSRTDSIQRDTSPQQYGYDSRNWTLNMGVDYRFNDKMLLGVALGQYHSNSDLDAKLATQEFDGQHLALYGSYALNDALSLNSTYHYGRYDHNSIRRTDSERFYSNTSSEQHSLNLGLNYHYHQHNLSIVPHLRLTLTTVELSAFDEKNSAGTQTYYIARHALHATYLRSGLDIAYAIPYSWGILTPMANVGLVRQVKHETYPLNIQDNDGEAWQLHNKPLSDAHMNISVGLIAQIADNKTLYANYETQLFHKYLERHSITAGLQFMF